MVRLTRAEALLDGLLMDVTDHACEQGLDLPVIVSAAVMHACGVTGVRAIVVLLMLVPDLVEASTERTVATLYAKQRHTDVLLHVVRERDDDMQSITITLADGGVE